MTVDVVNLRERADEALARYAWEEARDLLRATVAIEERPSDFEGLARAYRWLNDEAAALDADERAFNLFQREHDMAAAARMAIWLALDLLDFRGQAAVANGWLRRAHRLLDSLPPTPERGLLAGVEAYLRLMLHHDGPGAIALADEAVDLARESGPLDVEMAARAIKGLALVTIGEIESGMSLLDEASTAALGQEITEPSVRSTILCALMDACDRVRDFDRASQWCARIREAAERWTLPAVVTVCRPHYAVVLTWRGEWAEAETELLAAINESNASRPPMAVEGIVRLAELRLRQGRRDEAAELLRQVEHEDLAQLARAELALVDGAPQAAVELARRYLRRLPEDNRVERAPGLETLARACLAAGDLGQAGVAAAELRAIADAIGTGALQGAACFLAGVLAASRKGPGDALLARDALQDSVDLYAREGAPFEAARGRVEIGRLLAEDGAIEAADREWLVAKASFEAIGAERAAASVGELLSASPGAGGTSTRLPGLSERETEVLRLVATGCSNREIAEKLVLSVRTVERHVSNIYAKLGASGNTARAIVTAHAFRVGLVPAS